MKLFLALLRLGHVVVDGSFERWSEPKPPPAEPIYRANRKPA